jgi:calcium permeable stress-gated cation channel
VITRETIFFINLRNAYLLSPFNAARISARTVLFTDVPADYLKLDKLQMLFGATIRRAWLTTDCKALDDDVENRDKAAFKLEGAEIKLSKKANKLRLKAEKKAAKEAKKGKQTSAPVKSEQAAAKNEKDAVESQQDAVESQPDAAESQPDAVESQPDGVKSEQDASAAEPARTDADVEAGPVISEYLIKKDRPTHRLGKIPFIGKKVDTIDWCREELKTLIPRIETSQSTLRKGDGKLLPAVFIEFTNQRAAEAAYRRMTPRRAPHMYPRAISATPDQIIWNNLKIKKYERIARKFGTNGFLTLMIIFWAIPVAVVGSISNINYLTDKVHFLSFINDIPKVILGVVTGLLPSILLSVLMSLVPVVCRCKYLTNLENRIVNSRRDVETRWRGDPPSS